MELFDIIKTILFGIVEGIIRMASYKQYWAHDIIK